MFMSWLSISAIAIWNVKFFDTVCTSIHSKWVTNGINLPWSWGYLGTMSCKAELRSKVNQSSPHATFGYHLKLPKKTRRGKVTRLALTICQ